MSRLNWRKLFNEERVRKSTALKGHRNAFEIDYDRIVGSSSVRRLQDKAQVFPLQENDFTRTRLTHSLEVSAIASSLGKAVEAQLLDLPAADGDGFVQEDANKLPAMLRTAGLAHDLGNPPFGHYGEEIIQKWFRAYFENAKSIYKDYNEFFVPRLNELQMSDFSNFDGNVQNIRILTKLQMLNDPFGVNFTYATLASLIKYPWNSLGKALNGNEISSKQGKFGYFQSEEHLIKKIWSRTGLRDGVRHPATYLLEAADDITYICDDIEDGVKKGLIDWEKEFSALAYKVEKKKKDEFCGKEYVDLIEQYKDDIIMNGEFGERELTTDAHMNRFVAHLRSITRDNCFCSKEILSLELVGDRVITKLLDIYIPTVIRSSK